VAGLNSGGVLEVRNSVFRSEQPTLELLECVLHVKGFRQLQSRPVLKLYGLTY